MNKEIEILVNGKPTKMKLPPDLQDSKIVMEDDKVFVETGVVDYINNLHFENQELKERIHDLLKENTEWKLENQRLNNVLNELEKEIDKLLKKNYQCEEFAQEHDLETYLPAINDDLEYLKNKLKELKESDK